MPSWLWMFAKVIPILEFQKCDSCSSNIFFYILINGEAKSMNSNFLLKISDIQPLLVTCQLSIIAKAIGCQKTSTNSTILHIAQTNGLHCWINGWWHQSIAVCFDFCSINVVQLSNLEPILLPLLISLPINCPFSLYVTNSQNWSF